MKKKKIIDMDLYYEKLDNGLEIYVIPKNDCNNIYVTYNTKYGGKDNEFIPLNETKMKKFPKGIAHFLEHKLFEEEDNTNVFSFYQERGANANANTSYERTSYLFFGTEYFKENLEMLLHYVESPYFTDENVEKEKGIIEQEIKMYLETHPEIDSFVVIDDDYDMDFGESMIKLPSQRIHGQLGLDDISVNKAIKVLGKVEQSVKLKKTK